MGFWLAALPFIKAVGPTIAAWALNKTMNKDDDDDEAGSYGRTTPGPWPDPRMEDQWNDFMDSLGEMGEIATAHSEELQGIADQYSKPQYSIALGGQKLDIVPKRHISLMNALAGIEGQQFGMEMAPIGFQKDFLTDMMRMRYGAGGQDPPQPGVLDILATGSQIGNTLDRTGVWDWLGGLGRGTNVPADPTNYNTDYGSPSDGLAYSPGAGNLNIPQTADVGKAGTAGPGDYYY